MIDMRGNSPLGIHADLGHALDCPGTPPLQAPWREGKAPADIGRVPPMGDIVDKKTRRHARFKHIGEDATKRGMAADIVERILEVDVGMGARDQIIQAIWCQPLETRRPVFGRPFPERFRIIRHAQSP